MGLIHKAAPVFALIVLLGVFASRPALAEPWLCQGKTGCAAIGAVCADGTIFAGCPPNTYQPMYVTRCTGGRTYGAGCTGTHYQDYYKDGVGTGYTDVPGAESKFDGKANTTALVAADADTTGGVQQHLAAVYCDGLTIHGYSDWYLPAQFEMFTMFYHRALIPDYGTGGASSYWSSSQLPEPGDIGYATYIPNNGSVGAANKNTSRNVYCARKD